MTWNLKWFVVLRRWLTLTYVAPETHESPRRLFWQGYDFGVYSSVTSESVLTVPPKIHGIQCWWRTVWVNGGCGREGVALCRTYSDRWWSLPSVEKMKMSFIARKRQPPARQRCCRTGRSHHSYFYLPFMNSSHVVGWRVSSMSWTLEFLNLKLKSNLISLNYFYEKLGESIQQ